MIKIEREFAAGYARPVERGVCFWLDEQEQRSTFLDQLMYEALGDDYDIGSGSDLRGITISIEIKKAAKRG